ncbi:MAG: hypothetical protein KGI71_05585 [Patescibacteria group bacterium]|nr:hypothetical protein [Patescibacteria group bacterium]
MKTLLLFLLLLCSHALWVIWCIGQAHQKPDAPSWLHRLSHRLKLQSGYWTVWTTGSGRRMTGFRCDKCGAVERVHLCILQRDTRYQDLVCG